MTLLQFKNNGTLFYDEARRQTFRIYKIVSEHKVVHERVVYMVSIDKQHQQQFTATFFLKLIQSGKIKQL